MTRCALARPSVCGARTQRFCVFLRKARPALAGPSARGVREVDDVLRWGVAVLRNLPPVTLGPARTLGLSEGIRQNARPGARTRSDADSTRAVRRRTRPGHHSKTGERRSALAVQAPGISNPARQHFRPVFIGDFDGRLR